MSSTLYIEVSERFTINFSHFFHILLYLYPFDGCIPFSFYPFSFEASLYSLPPLQWQLDNGSLILVYLLFLVASCSMTDTLAAGCFFVENKMLHSVSRDTGWGRFPKGNLAGNVRFESSLFSCGCGEPFPSAQNF